MRGLVPSKGIYDMTNGTTPAPMGATSPSVNRSEHPAWCDLARCVPLTGRGEGGFIHHSAGTLVPVQGHEGDVTARLVSDDDMLDGVRAPGVDTHIDFIVRQHAWDNDQGGEMVARVALDPAEARQVASLLTLYADLAEAQLRYVEGGELRRRSALE